MKNIQDLIQSEYKKIKKENFIKNIIIEEHAKLKEDAGDIRKTLTSSKLRALMIEKGDAALETVRKEGAWTSIESLGASPDNIQTSIGVKRDDTNIAQNILSKIFSMQKPEAGKSLFDKAIAVDGDYVLISLSKVVDDTSEIDSALQQTYTNSISPNISQSIKMFGQASLLMKSPPRRLKRV